MLKRIAETKILVLIMIAVSILPVACSNQGGNISNSSVPRPQFKKINLPEYVPPKPVPAYKYQGGTYRDPFVLPGTSFSNMFTEGKVMIADDTLDKEMIAALKLRGIIKWEKNIELALINDAIGRSFTLRQGKLYNRKLVEVKGITGVIHGSSVVIFSSDTKVELKLKKNMEDK